MNKALAYLISLLLLMFVALNVSCTPSGGSSGGSSHTGDDDNNNNDDDTTKPDDDNNDDDTTDDDTHSDDDISPDDDTSPPPDDDTSDDDTTTDDDTTNHDPTMTSYGFTPEQIIQGESVNFYATIHDQDGASNPSCSVDLDGGTWSNDITFMLTGTGGNNYQGNTNHTFDTTGTYNQMRMKCTDGDGGYTDVVSLASLVVLPMTDDDTSDDDTTPDDDTTVNPPYISLFYCNPDNGNVPLTTTCYVQGTAGTATVDVVVKYDDGSSDYHNSNVTVSGNNFNAQTTHQYIAVNTFTLEAIVTDTQDQQATKNTTVTTTQGSDDDTTPDDDTNPDDDNDDDTTGIYVSGSVLELWGIGIANENVCLNTACDSTDSNGNFTITVDASGNYAVTVTEQSGDTYVNMSGQTINVPSGGLTGLEFILAQQHNNDGSQTLNLEWWNSIGGSPVWAAAYQHDPSTGLIYYNIDGLTNATLADIQNWIGKWQSEIDKWDHGHGYTLAHYSPGCDHCVKFVDGDNFGEMMTYNGNGEITNVTLDILGEDAVSGEHEDGHGFIGFHDMNPYLGLSVMQSSSTHEVQPQDAAWGYIAYMLNNVVLDNYPNVINYWQIHSVDKNGQDRVVQESLADQIRAFYNLPDDVSIEAIFEEEQETH